MKTLKSKVVCEDIHIEDYDKRRHRMKTMEREDLDLQAGPYGRVIYIFLRAYNSRFATFGSLSCNT